MVTGATDGIGKAMAFEFAKQGMNVVLISRSKDKLEDTQNELKTKYPKIDVRVLAIDYSQFDSKARAKVRMERSVNTICDESNLLPFIFVLIIICRWMHC